MIDFKEILGQEDEALNPFAGRAQEGTWIEGKISVPFLQSHFGHLKTATEMKEATTSEGLKRFFDWLAQEGRIPH